MDSMVDFLMKFGALGLFIHAFIDAVIFPIPAFFTQVSLSLLDPSNALWLATAGYIGCLLGTPVGYWIGKSSGSLFLRRILKRKWIDSATDMFSKNGEAAILLGAFTPIPFKIFTILSGCLNYSLWKLIKYAAIGRAVKFYVVGLLFYFFGKAAEGMVHQYLTIGLLVVAAIIAGVWFFRRKLKQRKNRGIQAENGSDHSL